MHFMFCRIRARPIQDKRKDRHDLAQPISARCRLGLEPRIRAEGDMKSLVGRALIGTFLLLGSLAIAGALPPYLQSSSAVIRVADTNDFATARDQYMREAQDEFQSWQDRMHEWTDAAKDKGSAMSAEAQRDLDKA